MRLMRLFSVIFSLLFVTFMQAIDSFNGDHISIDPEKEHHDNAHIPKDIIARDPHIGNIIASAPGEIPIATAPPEEETSNKFSTQGTHLVVKPVNAISIKDIAQKNFIHGYIEDTVEDTSLLKQIDIDHVVQEVQSRYPSEEFFSWSPEKRSETIDSFIEDQLENISPTAYQEVEEIKELKLEFQNIDKSIQELEKERQRLQDKVKKEDNPETIQQLYQQMQELSEVINIKIDEQVEQHLQDFFPKTLMDSQEGLQLLDKVSDDQKLRMKLRTIVDLLNRPDITSEDKVFIRDKFDDLENYLNKNYADILEDDLLMKDAALVKVNLENYIDTVKPSIVHNVGNLIEQVEQKLKDPSGGKIKVIIVVSIIALVTLITELQEHGDF